MKKDVHPKYYPECKVTCSCGNEFIVGSTRPELKVEICSACHPFYTGGKKIIDTTGRVERYKRILERKKELHGKRKNTK